MKSKTKKRLIIAAGVVLIVIAVGLGYWKRIGIRNTVMRMMGMDTSTSYGYYEQEVSLNLEDVENVNVLESDEAASVYDSEIQSEESLIAQTKAIDQEIQMELESGSYTWETPLVLNNPFKVAPLTGMILFETERPCRVRVTVRGKEEAYDLTGEIGEETLHRIPVVGLYPSYDNRILLELLNETGETVEQQEIIMTTSGLPEALEDAVMVEESSGESAYGLTMVYGQKTRYPYAFDGAGDIRWYLEKQTGDSGLFALSNQRFIMQDNMGYTPSILKPQATSLLEMDYLGRCYAEYYVANGTHHEVIEKEPGGNLLVLSSSLEGHVEDLILELDRKTGEVVNALNLEEIFGETYVNKIDWAHLNTVSYQKEDDTILISPRNLHSAMKINWTTHQLEWILGDPEFWNGTDFEEYVLSPEGEFYWHYQQHSVYQIEEDLDGDPATIHISMFDNHVKSSRNVESYDKRKDSYLKIYTVNEEEKTVTLEKEFAVQRSKITSNTVYDEESGHLFGMCGWLLKDSQDRLGKIYEFDYETGEIVRRYSLKNRYYRAMEMEVNYKDLARTFEPDEEYIKGELRAAVKTSEKIKEPKQTLNEGISLKRKGSVLYVNALDHHISQLIFKGESHSYVYDLTDIKLKRKSFLNVLIDIPVPMENFEPDMYQIYCVYQDVYYDTGFTIAKE